MQATQGHLDSQLQWLKCTCYSWWEGDFPSTLTAVHVKHGATESYINWNLARRRRRPWTMLIQTVSLISWAITAPRWRSDTNATKRCSSRQRDRVTRCEWGRKRKTCLMSTCWLCRFTRHVYRFTAHVNHQCGKLLFRSLSLSLTHSLSKSINTAGDLFIHPNVQYCLVQTWLSNWICDHLPSRQNCLEPLI